MVTIRTFINDFIKKELDNYLHKNPADCRVVFQRKLLKQRTRGKETSWCS